MTRTATLTIVIALLTACDRVPPPPADQFVRPARILIVTTDTAVSRHEFVAQVEAAQSIDLSFEVPGILAELPVLEGQTVARGGSVAALDAATYDLAVREAEVQVQLARQDLERKLSMARQGSVAQSVAVDAQSVYDLQLVRLSQAQESLADSRVHAPFDAYVAQRFVDNFVHLAPGEPVARLNDLHRLLVVAHIPEHLAATVTPEDLISLEAEFPFAPGERFALELFENRGEADDVAQTYEVSFAMQNPENYLVLPGMTATVHVSFGQADRSDRILLPSDALVAARDGGFGVWLFDAATGAVEFKAVQTATPAAGGVPVTAGLADGDMVVVTGADQVQADMRIRPLGVPSRMHE